MLRKLDKSTGNALGYEVQGKLTEQEFSALSEDFKSAIAEHGGVRLLIRMPEVPKAELGALWEDLKLLPYAKDVERYAIVGDNSMLAWGEKLADPVFAGEVKHFESSRTEEAWRWLRS